MWVTPCSPNQRGKRGMSMAHSRGLCAALMGPFACMNRLQQAHGMAHGILRRSCRFCSFSYTPPADLMHPRGPQEPSPAATDRPMKQTWSCATLTAFPPKCHAGLHISWSVLADCCPPNADMKLGTYQQEQFASLAGELRFACPGQRLGRLPCGLLEAGQAAKP